MINNNVAVLQEWIRGPATVGAVAPSSTRLTAQLVAPVPETGQPVVVELGPGTGAVSEVIQRRLGGRGVHLAVEINSRFAELLRSRLPGMDLVVADAVDLADLLAARGLPRADVIISGLPWAIMRRPAQRRLVAAVRDGLDDRGAFTTFAYMHSRWTPPGLQLRRLLQANFEEVLLGRTVWINLPPALVYHARRPRRPMNDQDGHRRLRPARVAAAGGR
jgi:phospholipid N-methyltransferase